MDVLSGLLHGLSVALIPQNIMACFLGAFLGTVTGVLPGLGPTSAMALLLPLTFGLPTEASIIMLAGIYYGAMYGGSTTSILLNMPGEAASMVTCFDGYQLSRKGRGGAALAVSALGSWVAGTLAVLALMLFAPSLARFALLFAPPEYFAITLLGLLTLNNLTGKSFIKASLMTIIGMMIGTIGMDSLSGYTRFVLTPSMLEGIDLVPVLMGLFGLSEVLLMAGEPSQAIDVMKVKFRELYPTKQEIKKSILPILRGTIIGFPIGLLPGPAAVLSSMASYKVEKSISKYPEEFGNGAIEGVAGPESANNAASTGTLVPLFALGLPFAPPAAMLLSGLMIHGINPGPLFITQHADLFWAVIGSMYIGNVMLLFLNLPFVGIFASLIKTPPRILMPIITSIMIIGAYSLNNSTFDIGIMLLFGIIGLVLKKLDFATSPLIIGLVLGPMFEENLRQGLLMVKGNFSLFFSRPLAAIFLILSIFLIIWPFIGGKKMRRIKGDLNS
ncbi:tripartite tricarboxylate transporter permease [Thermanaerosceptrum fracticalcis]|uniref:Tripartite tricarboxylate transporter permease n=1 Tax=Thermanaerosceptrum fracticalcis TaxID=1712410 RepID=A0A7G6E531_THEFR|nr:tripartite tricarboxylate transporter permease [Thermanaerosceptrum fracticalcis]QNB47185.1 tripartite tricarboxylate transporter permease [Thermanaerosceptrum fracticalcis]